jgi:hypothetical protein
MLIHFQSYLFILIINEIKEIIKCDSCHFVQISKDGNEKINHQSRIDFKRKVLIHETRGIIECNAV